jgi:hypothetical protein
MMRLFKSNVAVLIGLSLVLVLGRGVFYIWIGSWLPALMAGIIIVLFALSVAAKGAGLVLLAKVWGCALCLAGVLRLAFAALLSFQPGLSVHGPDMANPIFLTMTVGLLIAGFVIVRHARQLVSVP